MLNKALEGTQDSRASQVEESLLRNPASASHSQRSTKAGSKGSAAQHDVAPQVSSDVETWAQLATLYGSLGLDHFAQVTYSSHIARWVLQPR